MNDSAPTQQKELVAVTSPLGENVLVFQRMSGTEHLGQLFEYRVDVLSEEQINFADILGQNVTVRLDLLEEGKTRYFNGHVSEIAQIGNVGRLVNYQLTLKPWFWFLTRTADCRIFQPETTSTQTSVDIIKYIFREKGFSSYFDERLSGNFRKRDYCVQYRETDFNFISRLMEEDGITYYFKHEDGKHILVLADDQSSYDPIPDYESIPYFPPDNPEARERDHIFDWTVSQRVQPGRYTLNDFDFVIPKNPNQRLVSTLQFERPHAHASYEIFDYPGDYTQSGDGQNYSRIRIEELQAQHEAIQGRGNARGLTPGALFKLVDFPREDQNRQYLITSAHYNLQTEEYESGQSAEGGVEFNCTFNVLDVQQPYRPPRNVPKPVVQGPQSAIVTGPDGEEIHTDEHGRVKIHFHWDRYNPYDEKSSCWVRVSHPWAGKNWGAVAIPRIGQEVIVDFFEGDPDQPIITGRVYNGEQKPPYGLPAGKVISGLKSESTKGGGGNNEMNMDDTKGAEKLNLVAERDYSLTVKNDAQVDVGYEKGDPGSYTFNVHQDRVESVSNGDYNLGVDTGNRTTYIKTNDTLEVKGTRTEKVTATLHSEAANIKMNGKTTLKAESPDIEINGKTKTKIGSAAIEVDGKTVKVTGAAEVALSVGASSIVLNAGGVTIVGPLVKIN